MSSVARRATVQDLETTIARLLLRAKKEAKRKQNRATVNDPNIWRRTFDLHYSASRDKS
jgi:hypothetical protein